MNNQDKLTAMLINRMLRKGASEEARNLISNSKIDWEDFEEAVIYHDLFSFMHPALKDYHSLLPAELKDFLENSYYCSLSRCCLIWKEFLRILTAFQDAGIGLLPIKGVAFLADIYRDRPARPMTDIDLLVKEEDFQKAEKIFSALGYRKELYGLKEEYWRKKQCHIAFYNQKDPHLPFVELHWGFDLKRKKTKILPELWKRIRKINVDSCEIELLSPEDALFGLALHNRRFGRILCLKNVYDLVVLLDRYASGFDWDYVLREAKSGRMLTAVFFILTQAKIFFGFEIPLSVENTFRLSYWKKKLIYDFIEKNTFYSMQGRDTKKLYLRSHFLLYDSIWEPIDYIFHIPKEQFANFYGLQPYDKKTDFFYQMRLFYIPLKKLSAEIKNVRRFVFI